MDRALRLPRARTCRTRWDCVCLGAYYCCVCLGERAPKYQKRHETIHPRDRFSKLNYSTAGLVPIPTRTASERCRRKLSEQCVGRCWNHTRSGVTELEGRSKGASVILRQSRYVCVSALMACAGRCSQIESNTLFLCTTFSKEMQYSKNDPVRACCVVGVPGIKPVHPS